VNVSTLKKFVQSRRGLAVTATAVFLGLVLAACAARWSGPEPRCHMCGMDTPPSKARFVLEYKSGYAEEACCALCAAKLIRQQPSPLYRADVYAYDTSAMIDANQAFFVVGADAIPEGSMGPSVFAFSTQPAAEQFMQLHGGRIVVFSNILALPAPILLQEGRVRWGLRLGV